MQTKHMALIMLLLTAFCLPGKSQMPDSVRQHIDSCLLVLKEHALYADQVNWQVTEKKVLESAKTAKTKSETFEALKIAFDALGDKHAAYYQYNDAYKLDNAPLMNRYSDSVKAAWRRGPRIDGRMIGDVAYFAVPFMGARGQEQIDTYGRWLYNEVARLQKLNPKGWIIDLRLNGGGNIRPMMAGLAPFFEEGIVSYYISKDGEASDEAAFRQGDFLIDGNTAVSINVKIAGFPEAKVAVLIGPGTASSGEITAAVFSKRANTMLIGESTAGLANATNGFVFNHNNTYFLVSTARIAGKDKFVFPETIQPGIWVKGNDAFNDITQDEAVKKAINWLKQ